MVTLAVLRNNRTMETVVANEQQQRPRKRQCRARVRFSDQEPQTRVFNNFEAMTAEQSQQVCEQIWYTVRLD